MQKGFATLEIILVMLIIALLMNVAIPNATHVIDRVALDYETKSLYTNLRAVQAFDRMTDMRDSHFGKTEEDSQVSLVIRSNKYTIEKNSNGKIYAEHYFSNGVAANKSISVKFDDMGKVTNAKSETLSLTSRAGKTSIVFDSVGRFRGGRE